MFACLWRVEAPYMIIFDASFLFDVKQWNEIYNISRANLAEVYAFLG
jgi:hypothetical protein